MGTITLTPVVTNTVIASGPYNTVLSTIQTVINGNLDYNNLMGQPQLVAGELPIWNGSAFLRYAPHQYSATNVVSATNTDLSWSFSYSRFVQVIVSTGGGTLRSFGAPTAGAGTILNIRNGSSSAVTIKHNTAGGSGAVLATVDGNDVSLAGNLNQSVTFVYTGGSWVEIARDVTGATTYANAGFSPSNPTGTTSSTGVMMGLGSTVTLTPSATGKVLIMARGHLNNNTSADGATAQIRYGTGSAPANGAALTGTAAGATAAITQRGGTSDLYPITLTTVATGLTVNTAYWFDVSLSAQTGGTATIQGISYNVTELP